MSSDNPYAAPVSADPVKPALTDAEATRKKYLKHEASVQSIGVLYTLGAILLFLAAGIALAAGIGGLVSGQGEMAGVIVMLVVGCVYVALAILQGATSFGLRKLKTWARWVAVVFSVIGLLGFPIGTLISAYFLYLLLSAKGTVVFSDEYKEVIAATPHIKYKTSIIVIIFLVLLVLLLVLGMLAFLLGGTT